MNKRLINSDLANTLESLLSGNSLWSDRVHGYVILIVYLGQYSYRIASHEKTFSGS